MLIKLGEAVAIRPTDIRPTDEILKNSDLEIDERMRKFAQELKAIAPKANDFLYFTCVMMHAAEASLLDDNGDFRKTAGGENISASWEKAGRDGIKWVCTDPSIKPYKNSNCDIFPESELKKAYKKWVGKPLCLDHKSSSVDMIRGVIVDTVYDDRRKRVIALCALDKKNYKDLAHKVASLMTVNVSMGTAVGRAVCTEEGCHRVARTEADFCEHMRRKSAYGEINLDLNPLELSLVVTGADPKAKIKHIIAKDLSRAADNLSDYLEKKKVGATTDEINQIREALSSLMEKVETLAESAQEDANEAEAIPSTGSQITPEPIEEQGVPSNQPQSGSEPWPSYASELQQMVLGTQVKLAKLHDDFQQLINKDSSGDGDNMTTKNAYYQGTVEPNAGGTTYQPEPENVAARTQDKHMVGAPPFPEVGPVDGQYPGVGESDAEVRKRLLRQAEEEQRRMRRMAALEKAKERLEQARTAYPQGTEEPNEGGVTYKPDSLNEKARMDDKHMVGQPPFPDVGPVDSLHPSPQSADEKDELKRKEMLARANLKARFRKVTALDGSIDKAASRWDIYANDKLVISATVNDITHGNVETLYDQVATKKFGGNILGKIKAEGDAKLRQEWTKTAQPVAPAAEPAPAAAAPVAEPPVAGEVEPPVEGGGAEGDQVDELVAGMDDLIAELGTQFDQLKQKMNVLEGEGEELAGVPEAGEGSIEAAGPAATPGAPPPATASLQSYRKTLNGKLVAAMNQMAKNLQAHATELSLTTATYANEYSNMNGEQRQHLNSLAADGVTAARNTLSNNTRLNDVVHKYAFATATLIKTAMAEEEEEDEKEEKEEKEEKDEKKDDKKDDKKDKGDDCMADDSSVEDFASIDDLAAALDAAEVATADVANVGTESCEEDVGEITLDIPDEAMKDATVVASPNQFDLNTKEGRAMYRTKLAQKGLSFLDLSHDAHPEGSKEPGGFETKPSGDLAEIEVVEDTQKAMLDLAKAPPKVRKAAAEIARWVEAGQLDPAEVDELVAHGIDQEAVAYYKKFWAEAKDQKSNEFANELTKEHQAQKQAEEMKNYEERVKRAYDLAYEMRDKGFIEDDQVKRQVSDILSWNDASFMSVKSMLSKQQGVVKKASVPSVGLLHSGDVILPHAEPAGNQTFELSDYLNQYFGNRKF